MLYHLIYPLSEYYSFLNVFRYITVRSFFAFVIATIVSIVWGRYFIEYIKRKQFGQIVRDDGPKEHLRKAGTPTFGGILIGLSILISLIVCGNFNSKVFIVTILVTFSFFLLGLTDDYLKLLKKNPKGVRPKYKLLWQILTALIASWYLNLDNFLDTSLYIPFFKGPLLDLGIVGSLIFSIFVIVGSSNAVNLTDGLDGLAIGPIMTSAATLGFLSYLSGHNELSSYLYLPYIEGSGELVIFAASIIGAGVGFLWYNSYPAQIFMGDVGSLALGGALGMMALCTKNEVLFILIGGIFVIETLSVILQVGSFKARGKRIFKMAPIHHHYELKGWPEPKVIVRFWIISIIFSILAIATVKLR